ncbi:metal ABC transporter ATP-binding protein [soil metagenome]
MEQLTLAYGAARALVDATFAVPAGTVAALIGPNGSGKSTLLHALAGLLPARSGRLSVLGRDPETVSHRVAYVLQATQVNSRMPITVTEVVSMGRYAERGWFRRLGRIDKVAVHDAMERLQVADLAGRQLGDLSGGQRQRVFVAQGLAQQADLLLLDEPVSGVDLPSQQAIFEAVTAERARGSTVIFSTHDLGEARRADQLVLLAGRVVAAGPSAVVLTSEHLAAAYGDRLVRLADGALLLDDGAHHHDDVGHHH